MRFLIDANLTPDLAVSLREHGHDAVHLFERGIGELDDEPIVQLADGEDRILITLDLDFARLLALTAAVRPSVILFRTDNGRPEILEALLLKAIAAHARDLRAGVLLTIEEHRVRIRRLPINEDRDEFEETS
jgi:predicted nuclease of predicted toxin-antitoxin system